MNTTTTYSRAGAPAPRPTYQPLPQPLATREPATVKSLAQRIFEFAKSQMPEGAERRDLDRVLADAHALVEVEAAQERAVELSRRIAEQQAAEAERRARGTAADPAVQAEMEVLKRLTSPALNLLRDADLTPPQRIAVDLLLAGRAAEALTKATAAE